MEMGFSRCLVRRDVFRCKVREESRTRSGVECCWAGWASCAFGWGSFCYILSVLCRTYVIWD